jgi:chemotaxis protein MotA
MSGAAFGLLLVLTAVATTSGGLDSLFSFGGLIIVFGGVVAVAFMSFRAEDVRTAINAIATMLKGASPLSTGQDLQRDIDDIVAWSHLVSERGNRGLERSLPKSDIADPLVSYGLNLVVSGYPEDEVRAMMQTASETNYERGWVPVDILRAMSSHAPAFGMVGTLIGMISMLHNLNDDIASIGSTLGIAFLSTLYGVLSARMIYLPAAARLEQEVDGRCVRDRLITEGMAMLTCNKPPMYIRDRLNGFLPPDAYNYYNMLVSPAAPVPHARVLRMTSERNAQASQAPLRRLRVVKA